MGICRIDIPMVKKSAKSKASSKAIFRIGWLVKTALMPASASQAAAHFRQFLAGAVDGPGGLRIRQLRRLPLEALRRSPDLFDWLLPADRYNVGSPATAPSLTFVELLELLQEPALLRCVEENYLRLVTLHGHWLDEDGHFHSAPGGSEGARTRAQGVLSTPGVAARALRMLRASRLEFRGGRVVGTEQSRFDASLHAALLADSSPWSLGFGALRVQLSEAVKVGPEDLAGLRPLASTALSRWREWVLGLDIGAASSLAGVGAGGGCLTAVTLTRDMAFYAQARSRGVLDWLLPADCAPVAEQSNMVLSTAELVSFTADRCVNLALRAHLDAFLGLFGWELSEEGSVRTRQFSTPGGAELWALHSLDTAQRRAVSRALRMAQFLGEREAGRPPSFDNQGLHGSLLRWLQLCWQMKRAASDFPVEWASSSLGAASSGIGETTEPMLPPG